MWRNGQAVDSQADFIPIHRFPSLDSVFEQKESIEQQLKEIKGLQRVVYAIVAGHRQRWMTILDDGAGNGYFYDPHRSDSDGAVFCHFAEDGHYMFFPSVRNLLAGIVECYDSGAYFVDETGCLVENYEQSREVWQRYGTSNLPDAVGR